MLTERQPNSGSISEEGSTCPAKRLCTSLDEQREATRFEREAGTDFAVIWQESDEAIAAEVHDESLTGLGILVDSELDLALGSRVHVVYAGEHLDGEVRHITRQPNGKNLVGLRCQPWLPESVE